MEFFAALIVVMIKYSRIIRSFYILAGVPLPVIGFVMYGLVTALSAQLGEGNLPFGISKTNGRFALFGITTAMASASAYFLYILSTKLSGSSCPYCLVSAFLSFSLFFLSLKVPFVSFSFTFCIYCISTQDNL